MSLQARLNYQYQQVSDRLSVFALPDWMFSVQAKVVMLALIVILAFTYLFQINTLSTSGYAIHTWQDKLSAIDTATNALQTEVAAYQSLSSIQSRLSSLTMVEATGVAFVKVGHETVVAAR